MAGNRLQRTGSIFSRLFGIIKSGAMKEEDIPMWYQVYKAFPPKYDPSYARPAVMKEIQPIFYPEDIIRGKFAKVYGAHGQHDLMTKGTKFILQRFVEKYTELEKTGNYSNEAALLSAIENALAQEGLILQKLKKISPIQSQVEEKLSVKNIVSAEVKEQIN